MFDWVGEEDKHEEEDEEAEFSITNEVTRWQQYLNEDTNTQKQQRQTHKHREKAQAISSRNEDENEKPEKKCCAQNSRGARKASTSLG